MGSPALPPAPDGVRIDSRRAPRRLISPATVAGALVAAAIAVAAFLMVGSSGGPIGGPLAQAATYSAAAAGYRVRMSVQVTSADLNRPITLRARGLVDMRDRASAMSMAMNLADDPQVVRQLGGTTLRMKIIQDPHAVYVRMPSAVAAAALHSRRPWIKIDITGLSGMPGVSSLAGGSSTSDPRQVLQSIRAVSDDILNEGEHRVDGVPTTEYFADIGVSRLVASMPAADRPGAQQWASVLRKVLPDGEIPTRVWVDAHHLVRRINMILAMSASGASLVETVTMDLSHYGPQKPPKAPRPNQVTDMSGISGTTA